ncbi:DUF4153 domain-containing protein [Rubripirellula reticaptiva]|uniref:Uncharacterized protein n=1 Tax=Rubripirellula reticaptiva TaxID=2528013 RepID=A0A5C6FC42_9BACT|nr:DUF4153 domain-containing protein [Rubripirellula reticaptiva]TWU58180.1 hypothetical protein Poly59_10890 [Rubripirellula reticaptiva]
MTGDFSQTPVSKADQAIPNGTSDAVVSPGVREVAAAAIWTLLADLLIFRSDGYTGLAIFLVSVPILFFWLFPTMLRQSSAKWTIGILAVVAARLVWSGSSLTVFSGMLLVVAVSMVAAGSVPMVLEGIVLASRALFDGAIGLGHFHLSKHLGRGGKLPAGSLSVLLPIVAAGVFGSIFVFANPDLLDRVSASLTDVVTSMVNWITGFSIWEIPFCVVALLLGIGLMRPRLPMIRVGSTESAETVLFDQAESQWYAAFRNTLITVTALFAVYLGFEWMTLWKREFPEGFYYAGYAHQGAAWLTFALALATGMLSLIFRGSILADPRLDSLRKLAWIWSGASLLLAVAVYNRLLIYVGYNGMTRMRTVGFFGITLVVIGFGLVLYKIGRQRNLWWLLRGQLIAFALTVIAYSVFPVDYAAHHYNVARVSDGYLRPSVMIAVKPIEDEGVVSLLGLVDCPDPIIREGVRAKLAQRQETIGAESAGHWTAYQASTSRLRRVLKANESKWSDYDNRKKQERAINAFREYAMQWY